MDLLGTLGDIFAEQGHWEPASVIYDELLKSRADSLGPADPQTLAAKGALAIALFELGQIDDSFRLEKQAIEEALTCLGVCHSVTTVLAWNRALRHEIQGDDDMLQTVFRNELSWLLLRDACDLSTDQQNIKALLAKRWSINLKAAISNATCFPVT